MLKSDKNLSVITKIILFYSIFFVGIKLFVILQGAWLIPNLVLCVPFIVFTIVAGIMVKNAQYSWPFTVFAIFVTIAVRIYETQLTMWIQDML